MYRRSDFTKAVYRTGEVARILGVTTRTVQQYDHDGKLPFRRSDGNRRILLRDDLINYLVKIGLLYDDADLHKRDVLYARVSSHDLKQHGDLDRQALYLVEHTSDLQNPLVMKEVGSGLNDKRRQLQQLLRMVCNNEVRNVYVTYKDRLTRFGYHYLETMFLAHGVKIITVKDCSEERNVQEELVEDMMSLIASFSGKLYGMRSRKQPAVDKIREETSHE